MIRNEVNRFEGARLAMRGTPSTPTSPRVGVTGWMVIAILGILLATCHYSPSHSIDTRAVTQ